MTHEEARMKVCAVCTNLWGYKAARKVTPEEENLIQQDVLEVYTSCNMFFPSGICVRCIHPPADPGQEGGQGCGAQTARGLYLPASPRDKILRWRGLQL